MKYVQAGSKAPKKNGKASVKVAPMAKKSASKRAVIKKTGARLKVSSKKAANKKMGA